MNREELLKNICESTGATKSLVDGILKSFMDEVTDALKKGDDVRLIGFGIFKTSKREATTGRNPRTGEAMEIKASIRPKFVAGKTLVDSVNS